MLLEALYLNKKIGVISDFGISRKIGNYTFIGANVFVTLDDLAEKKIPTICMKWKKDNCIFNESIELKERLHQLFYLKLPLDLEPYYTEKSAPFFFEEKKNNIFNKGLFKALWEKLKNE